MFTSMASYAQIHICTHFYFLLLKHFRCSINTTCLCGDYRFQIIQTSNHLLCVCSASVCVYVMELHVLFITYLYFLRFVVPFYLGYIYSLIMFDDLVRSQMFLLFFDACLEPRYTDPVLDSIQGLIYILTTSKPGRTFYSHLNTISTPERSLGTVWRCK